MCTVSSPFTIGEKWSPRSTDFQTSFRSRSRREVIRGTDALRYATRPPFLGVRITTTVTNRVRRPVWRESVPTWTAWPSLVASLTNWRMSGILTSFSVFHIVTSLENGGGPRSDRAAIAIDQGRRIQFGAPEASNPVDWFSGPVSIRQNALLKLAERALAIAKRSRLMRSAEFISVLGRFELSWPDGVGTLAVCWAPHSPFPLRDGGRPGSRTLKVPLRRRGSVHRSRRPMVPSGGVQPPSLR